MKDREPFNRTVNSYVILVNPSLEKKFRFVNQLFYKFEPV